MVKCTYYYFIKYFYNKRNHITVVALTWGGLGLFTYNPLFYPGVHHLL